MSKYRALVIVVAVILLAALSILWVRRPSLVVVPVGKFTDAGGTRFVVGITNRSAHTWTCVAGNTMVSTNAGGVATTNLTSRQQVRVEPKSGLQVAIIAPTNQVVWTVMTGFLREMGAAETRLRLDAVRYGFDFSGIGTAEDLRFFEVQR